jgi:hypothetical protein
MASPRKPHRDDILIGALAPAHRWRRRIDTWQARSIEVSGGRGSILKRLKPRIERLQALVGLAKKSEGMSVCIRRRSLGLHDSGGS